MSSLLSSLSALGISRNVQGGVVNTAMEALGKVLTGAQNNNIKLHALDHRVRVGVAFSSVVMTMRDGENIAARVILLAASNETPPPIVINQNGKSISIPRVPAGALDDVYKQAVMRLLGECGYTLDSIIYCGGDVVQPVVNWADAAQVTNVFVTAQQALVLALRDHTDTLPMVNLADHRGAAATESLQLSIVSDASPTVGYDNMPLHRTLHGSLTVVPRNGGQNLHQSMNTASSGVVLGEADTFVTFLYDPAKPAQQYGFVPGQVVEDPRIRYTPRVVVTRAGSPSIPGIQGTLMGLFVAASMLVDRRWWAGVYPQAGQSDRLDDVGALNILGNIGGDPSGIGQPIKTDTVNFGMNDFTQLMATLVRSMPVLSMMVTQAGPDAFVNNVFVRCARGDTTAVKAVIDCAQQLTGNRFASHYTDLQANPVVVVGGETTYADVDFAGYWEDRMGNRRPMAELDMLAVAKTRGASDPSVITDFTDTYARLEYDPAMRLYGRQRIRDAVAGAGRPVITDMVRLVTFTPAFCIALVRGIRETGLDFTEVSANPFSGNAGQVASADWARQAQVNTSGMAFQQAGPAGTGFYF